MRTARRSLSSPFFDTLPLGQFVVGLALLLLLPGLAWAAGPDLPNPRFDSGDATPSGWTLHGGEGRWLDRQVLEVRGAGDDSSYWSCAAGRFEPGRLYHFQFRARRQEGSGSAIAGPGFANRDYHDIGSDWSWFGHTFRVPERPDDFLRVGHWHANGALEFDEVKLTPALPVHRRFGDALVLGEGEMIRDGQYQFQGLFGHPGSNDHRVLHSASAGFNSDRWCFGGGAQVTYRFALPGYRFQSGQVRFQVNYHTRGVCTAQVSRDGEHWQAVATQDGLGMAEAALPAALLPAETVWLRLQADDDASFQVNEVGLEAALDGAPPDASGDTVYADLEGTDPSLEIQQITLAAPDVAGEARLDVQVTNPDAAPVTRMATATVVVRDQADSEPAVRAAPLTLTGGASGTFSLALPASQAGRHEVLLELADPADGRPSAQARLTLEVPEYYRSDYGYVLDASPAATVWWCQAGHKIPRQRAAPAATAPAVALAAARNDFEPVQVVLRPTRPLVGLTATAGPLRGPNGAVIAAEEIDILQVYYHFVHHATDATGVRDWWPDALPPLAEPLDLPADQNQPLWVLVHVPQDAPAGDYQGTLDLAAEGWALSVPLKLRVWDFTLPDRNHLETAFGLSAGTIFQYHNLRTEEDKRKVLDLYLQSFARHRISPYDPAPLDPIRVRFLPDAEPPRAEVDSAAFERELERVLEAYHFTNLRLPIQGMGGGTFHERYEPRIGDYGQQTPQYQAMFSSYLRQLEDCFRRHDWLDLPYIYWFDEPDPKDYQFVRQGMERLKRYAPALRTMLTEEPQEALAGPVDIWCPVSFNYDHQAAEARRAHGERFWWYVCCGPKAPYCTLFIDHPATELRVWHWQTWERNIVGTLVWTSNYWTSTAAYPDSPQNPYEDPMGYVSGYSTPHGVKRYLGNGDGRFLYPPLAAAVPGKTDGPVLEPPVSSIRWEMIREGVEDYEYLWLLRDRLARRRASLPPDRIAAYEALLAVPDAITDSMTSFTTDPAPILAARAAIAAAIEALAE